MVGWLVGPLVGRIRSEAAWRSKWRPNQWIGLDWIGGDLRQLLCMSSAGQGRAGRTDQQTSDTTSGGKYSCTNIGWLAGWSSEGYNGYNLLT
jgi:hypothetical protein